MSRIRPNRATKIVATVGPASWEPPTLKQVILAGADVIRINAAHNDIPTRRWLVSTIRTAAADAGRRIAILQDLAGPKPRTGPARDGEEIVLRRDHQVQLVEGDALLEPGRVSIDDADLVQSLRPGQRVLMVDGLIDLVVESRQGRTVTARVVRGGRLRGRQGVTVPGGPLPPRKLTPQEAEDIAFAAEQDLEYLGISFVTSAGDVEMVRKELRRHGGRAGIVAKIERPEALDAIHEITHATDALMVARGDLGVQLPPEEVPIAQKRIIEVTRRHGVPVITATQMLESMTTQPIPTRAETSDVANAVIDGSDAVMLSGETATGEYPVEAVQMMSRIISTVERHFPATGPRGREGPATIASTIARAANDITHSSSLVNLIGVVTRSGYSAREVASARPDVPVIALTNNEFVANQLQLIWGISVIVAPFADNTETLFTDMTEHLIAEGYAQSGDHVLFIGSLTVVDAPGYTNLLHLRQL